MSIGDRVFDRAHCPLKEGNSLSVPSSNIRELNERTVGKRWEARAMMDDKIGGVYTRYVHTVTQPGKETFKFGKAIIQTAPDSTYHYIFLTLLRGSVEFYSL